jgi:hypothetical protein
MHITAGILGSVYDLPLFRDTQDQLTKLVTSKPGEPSKILADKESIGFKEDRPLQLVTPYKKPAHGTLRPTGPMEIMTWLLSGS